jgi:NADP-dependent 3-hydroxy acid dehydrogenase YdfG
MSVPPLYRKLAQSTVRSKSLIMKKLFKDKVVIVTGASSGIGEAIARKFALNGSKVVLAARTESRLSKITDEIIRSGGEAFYIITDVSLETDCRKLIEKTIEKYSGIDIMVNNAGLSCVHLFRMSTLGYCIVLWM